jgi:thiamine biosynthesis lipoprotein ApbE
LNIDKVHPFLRFKRVIAIGIVQFRFFLENITIFVDYITILSGWATAKTKKQLKNLLVKSTCVEWGGNIHIKFAR